MKKRINGFLRRFGYQLTRINRFEEENQNTADYYPGAPSIGYGPPLLHSPDGTILSLSSFDFTMNNVQPGH